MSLLRSGAWGHIGDMNFQLLPYFSLVRLTGADTINLLERLVTCRVDTLVTGDQTPGALLTPQGKVIADFLLTRTAEGCDLVVHTEAAEDLAKRLKMFRLRAAVAIEILELPAAQIDQAARIEAGLAAFGQDFTSTEVFPTDINLDVNGGIDYKKGCFVGQEVVSRMKRRGKVRKRTLVVTGSGLSVGANVSAGDKRLGEITSTAEKVALARLRTDHLMTAMDDGVPITVDGEPVEMSIPSWLAAEVETTA